MKTAKSLTSTWILFGAIIFVGWISACPDRAEAQAGDNAICNSPTGCTTAPSPAFIDASVFGLSTRNICGVLNGILSSTLTTYPPAGAVIDARGLPGLTQTGMTCTASPWGSGSSYVNLPSTILLPTGTITIPSTWIVPSGTKLIGEGTNVPTNGSGVKQTTVQVCNPSCFSGSAIIQFGGGTGAAACPAPACTGISLEQVTLNGNSQNVVGILNTSSQEQSYVDHVTLYQILGIGLSITLNAQNSGPYSNITYDTNGMESSTAACAQIKGVNGGTRGIQGLTCKSGNYSPAAIYLDSSNNTIKDVRILGFDDGILVGSQAAAQSNILLNILGDTDRTSTSPINVVHIASGTITITDLSIISVTNQGNAANTIQDDRTSAGVPLTDTNVAMYVLGKSTADGYSRFTTSPNEATWAIGTSSPPTGTCASGSLYSNTSTGGGALYVCVYGTPNAWKAVVLN